jgi:hypothetical protein
LPSAAERALHRERLRRRREALLLELGALVYELHRQGRRAPELLKQKAAELAELEAQLSGLEEATGAASGDAVRIDPDHEGQSSEHAAETETEAEADGTGGEAEGAAAEAGAPQPPADAGAPDTPAACPSCGEAAEPGQLVCLNCGSRLDLGRKPRSIVPALAALIAVVVIGAGAFGFALSELTGGDDTDDVGASAAEERAVPEPSAQDGAAQTASGERAPRTEAAPTTETAPQGAPRTESAPGTETAPGTPQQQRRSLLLEWPTDLTAHTVVLVTTSDRPAALRLARSAARSGIEAGLLRADDYNLGSDLWIVFAGRFDTRRGAARQASNLAARYPGAYVQLIRPSG